MSSVSNAGAAPLDRDRFPVPAEALAVVSRSRVRPAQAGGRAGVQFDLFEHVAGAYAQPASGRLSNRELYRMAAGRAGVDANALEETQRIGRAEVLRSPLKRQLRWHQQTLRQLGLIARVPGERGIWELTAAGRHRLRKVRDGAAVLAFSTDLGIAIWSSCTATFERIAEPICCVITSPPYPLATPRAYGGPSRDTYIDFITRSLEPLVRNLVPGGNVALNVGDVYESGSPAKSTYIEELILALRERLGLQLMNKIVWASNKPPGPVKWASMSRQQLNEGYEYVLWFCSDPVRCLADNRRVLEPHSANHKRLMEGGGERRNSIAGDGAHRIRRGSYGRETAGRIPRTVWPIANHCASQREYKARAKDLGLAVHGAAMPLALARKLVLFLADVGHLTVDPFAGSFTVPLACELEGRPWIATDDVYDYVRGGATRFEACAGYSLSL